MMTTCALLQGQNEMFDGPISLKNLGYSGSRHEFEQRREAQIANRRLPESEFGPDPRRRTPYAQSRWGQPMTIGQGAVVGGGLLSMSRWSSARVIGRPSSVACIRQTKQVRQPGFLPDDLLTQPPESQDGRHESSPRKQRKAHPRSARATTLRASNRKTVHQGDRHADQHVGRGNDRIVAEQRAVKGKRPGRVVHDDPVHRHSHQATPTAASRSRRRCPREMECAMKREAVARSQTGQTRSRAATPRNSPGHSETDVPELVGDPAVGVGLGGLDFLAWMSMLN